MGGEAVTISDILHIVFNFAEFPIPKLILSFVLALGAWFAAREMFDTRLATFGLVRKLLFGICAFAFFYLLVTMILGLSETAHAGFARVDTALNLSLDVFREMFGGRPRTVIPSVD